MEQDNKLLEIKGYEIHPPGEYSLEAMEVVKDLIYFDGPIFSLCRLKSNGAYFLVFWIDHDTECNRWLIWEIQEGLLQQFLAGEVPGVDTLPAYVTILDIGDDPNDPRELIYLREWSVRKEDIPQGYVMDKSWKPKFDYRFPNE